MEFKSKDNIKDNIKDNQNIEYRITVLKIYAGTLRMMLLDNLMINNRFGMFENAIRLLEEEYFNETMESERVIKNLNTLDNICKLLHHDISNMYDFV